MAAKRKHNAGTFRARQIGAIHALAKKLRLDDDRDAYEALLMRVGGAPSSADLDQRGRAKVLDEMRKLLNEGQQHMQGAVPITDAPQNVREEIAGMVAKVGAILAEIGKSWNYAHGTAKRMFHVQRVEWLRADQLHRLVAALQISANRRKA